MQVVTTVGLDISKSVFQVHGINAGNQVVIRRQLKRRYVLTFIAASASLVCSYGLSQTSTGPSAIF